MSCKVLGSALSLINDLMERMEKRPRPRQLHSRGTSRGSRLSTSMACCTTLFASNNSNIII